MGLSFRKILKSVGRVALPVVGGLVGGPLGAAAGGALGGAIGSGKPKLGNIALGAGEGFAGAKLLGGGLHLPGGGAAATDAGTYGGVASGGSGPNWGGILKSVGSGLLSAAPAAVAGYGMYENAKQASQGNALEQEALDMARARAAELAPLRTAGISGALDTYQHPVSPLDAVGGYVDAGNPYSHAPAGGAAPVPSAAMRAASAPALGGVTPILTSRGGRTARARRSLS